MAKRLLLTQFFLLTLTVSSHADQRSYVIVDPSSIPKYDLNVRILPETHRLEASGTVRLPASTNARDTLNVALSELMDDLHVEVVQPSASAGSAKLEKKERPWVGASGWGTNEWTIRPARPIPAGESVLLRFSYTGGGEKTSFVFYLGPEASFAAGTSTAWYPETEDSSGEGRARLNGQKSIGTLNFTVPAGYTVIASGANRSTTEEIAQGHFHFEVAQPVSLSFAAGKYSVLRRNGSTPMSIYLLRPRQNIEKYLDGSSKILDVLVREFGPAPYGTFALVEVPDEQAGNAGFNGASEEGFILTSSSSLDAEFNPNHYGHEISHQWWGNLIRNKGPHGYLMLDEAMAQYGALVAVEALQGPKAAAQFRLRGDIGTPIDESGIAYLTVIAGNLDHRLSDLPLVWISREIADSKGYLVYDLLSRTVGRERYRQILHNFTERHAYERVTLEDFLGAIEKESGQNLKWFYDQWFERTDAPDWRLTSKQDRGILRCKIVQSAPYFRAVVDIQVEDDSCHQIVRSVDIRGPLTEFAWPVKFKVDSVILDPEFKVPHWTTEYRAEATALAPYWQGLAKWQEGKSSEAQQIFKSALERAPTPDPYSTRFMFEEGWARVLQGDKSLSKEKKLMEREAHLRKALASPTRRADWLPWVYYLLATVAEQSNDDVTLRWAAENAITADAALGRGTEWAGAARTLLSNRRAQ